MRMISKTWKVCPDSQVTPVSQVPPVDGTKHWFYQHLMFAPNYRTQNLVAFFGHFHSFIKPKLTSWSYLTCQPFKAEYSRKVASLCWQDNFPPQHRCLVRSSPILVQRQYRTYRWHLVVMSCGGKLSYQHTEANFLRHSALKGWDVRYDNDVKRPRPLIDFDLAFLAHIVNQEMKMACCQDLYGVLRCCMVLFHCDNRDGPLIA